MAVHRRLRGAGLSLREALPPADLARVATAAEGAGAASLWLPEFALREAFGQLGFLAGTTRRLALATGVAPLAARTPANAAMAAATLDDLSGGRAILGLGVSHRPMNEGWHNAHPRSVLDWAEEYLTVVRAILAGQETSFSGREVSSHGFRLLDGGRPDVPLVLAALGPRMLALAGRVADGVLLNWTTPEYAAQAADIVGDAAASVGRPPPAIGAYVRIAAGPDAADHARRHAEFYAALDAYARSLIRMGIDGSDLPRRAADALILRGDAEGIARRLLEWREAGVAPLVLYPVGDGPAVIEAISLAIETLARCSDDPHATPEASS